MTRRALAWLTAGLMLFAAGCAGFGAVTVLGDLHHPARWWVSVAVGLALGLGWLFVWWAFNPIRRE